ncbi:MAG: helix-turn-helix transcriptional regulator [Bacteroidetes bacterium]|nr:helix-turn-helix transcriptional regulator [Bacteroidota bacterium]
MEQVQQLIPNRLRKLRFRFGYTQKQVAFLISVGNPSDIARWENGSKMPNAANMLKLSALYRTSCNELYYDVLNRYKQDITMKEHVLFNDAQ